MRFKREDQALNMNDYFKDNKRSCFVYLKVTKLKFESKDNCHMKASHEIIG